MRIDNERIMHMHNVAEYMYEHAKDYGLDSIKDELYAIGLVHDIGAAIDKTNHEINGANMLSKLGLNHKYVDIIKYHGNSPEQYCIDHNVTEDNIPNELLLLWEADLHTGPSGEFMSFDERINDMIMRHRKIVEESNDFNPHVLLIVNDDNLVTEIHYHETYGDIAKSVVRLLNKRGRK